MAREMLLKAEKPGMVNKIIIYGTLKQADNNGKYQLIEMK